MKDHSSSGLTSPLTTTSDVIIMEVLPVCRTLPYVVLWGHRFPSRTLMKITNSSSWCEIYPHVRYDGTLKYEHEASKLKFYTFNCSWSQNERSCRMAAGDRMPPPPQHPGSFHHAIDFLFISKWANAERGRGDASETLFKCLWVVFWETGYFITLV